MPHAGVLIYILIKACTKIHICLFVLLFLYLQVLKLFRIPAIASVKASTKFQKNMSSFSLLAELKYLNYWMDCREILDIHNLQRMNPTDFNDLLTSVTLAPL